MKETGDPFTIEGFESLCQYMQEFGLEMDDAYLEEGQFFALSQVVDKEFTVLFNCHITQNVYVMSKDKLCFLHWPNTEQSKFGISSKWPMIHGIVRTEHEITYDVFLEFLKGFANMRRNAS